MLALAIILVFALGVVDGWMDRLREVHQLLFETANPERMLQANRNFWSYSPNRKGIVRDGWHLLKFLLRVLVACSVAFFPAGMSLCYAIPLIYAVNWIGFRLALTIARNRITAENNFR